MRPLHFRCENLLFAVLLLNGGMITAADRIVTPVNPQQTVILKGQVDPRAQAQYDQGRVEPSTRIGPVTLLLKPSDDLDSFLLEQQDPASPNYHRWLTPEQFAEKFGLGGADIAKLTSWLESQGLTVNDVARGRHWIHFSGSSDQISRAFRTEIHKYLVNGETHFANATAPSIPAAFENVVSAVNGLNDFRMKPMSIKANPVPELNSGSSHYLAPDDLATIYDIAPLYNAGITGAGQSLVVVGETQIDVTDIRAFRARFNLPPSDPQMIPSSPEFFIGEDPEADLDIEWSGAVARDATIMYVYSANVIDALQYAIDQNLAPVVSMSYGECELYATPGFRSVAQQANAQGITWMAASGDWGAATCDYTSPTPQAAKGLTVSFPADIPEVTAVGGTEFDEGSGNYWSPTNTANGASALSWIPEIAWNDSVERNALAATGGGASVLFAKPFWQTGPGVPNDNARDLPDVAFSSSPDHDGYEVYTGGSWQVYGGTSFTSPVFAGIVALLNQYEAAPGLGNINPTLYRLAQSSNDVFHDVTNGNNMVSCVQSSPDCSNGLLGYSAGPGYDPTTGLGSVDVWRLATEWSKDATAATTTSLTVNPASFLLSNTVQLTATVTSASARTVPTGTVTFFTTGGSLGTANLVATGQAATATLSVAGILLAAGNGTVSAIYSGDAVFNTSTGVATASLTLPPSGSFVVPSVTPNPVVQQNTGSSPAWVYAATLTEKAGVATTLTEFAIDGQDQPLLFWSDTYIAPYGTVSTGTISMFGSGLLPGNHVFHFAGADFTGGQTWSQNLTVPFVAATGPAPPGLTPSAALTITPPTVVQDPTQDSSCQWSYQLTVQEQAGFEVYLAQLSWSTGNFGPDGIQQLFGTTQLAPFGMLRASICRGGATGTDTYSLLGFAESGAFVNPSVSVTFAGPAVNPAAFSVSPSSVGLSAADSSKPASATLNLMFTGGAPSWTVQILPENRTSAWLTVSPLSGSGPAQLQLTGSAGLSNGVYQAVVTIVPDGASPQSISVPVTFVVGASNAISVDHASNAASSANVYSPGMMMAVIGSGLAPTPQQDSSLPLPLTLQGVSATVNGVSAPLYSVSPTQVDIQIPYETTLGAAVLGINNNGKVTSFSFPVAIAGPGIFADPNGSLIPSATGQQGQAVTAFVTGAGVLTPSVATGAAPDAGNPVGALPQPILPVTLTVGGVPAKPDFVGVPTWAVGTTQINFTIPANAPLGPQPVVVTVGGAASPPVTLTVTAAQ
jgi:uncharacterized protein (TIGR03437 family)